MADKESGTTRVTKRIGRKIQPKQFESLEISCEYEDTITWNSMKERQAKLDDHLKLSMLDFQKSFDQVCGELGVNDKAVAITHKQSDGAVKQGSAVSQAEKKDTIEALEENLFDEVK